MLPADQALGIGDGNRIGEPGRGSRVCPDPVIDSCLDAAEGIPLLFQLKKTSGREKIGRIGNVVEIDREENA